MVTIVLLSITALVPSPSPPPTVLLPAVGHAGTIVEGLKLGADVVVVIAGIAEGSVVVVDGCVTGTGGGT